MKKFHLLLSIILLGLTSKAQLSFEKIYTIHTWSIGTDVIEVDSGNFICVGVDSKAEFDSLNHFSNERITGLVMKLDQNGDTLKTLFIGWKDTVSYSSWGDFSYLRIQTIHNTEDNHLFLASTFSPKNPISIYEGGVLIMKMNYNLDTIWTRQFYSLNSQTLVWWTCNTSDNGFAITGKRTYSFPLTNYTYLIRVDSFGNLMFDKNYPPDSPFIRMTAQGICQTSDGGFLITGWEDDLNDYSVPFCIRTDSAGNELWRFTIPFNSRNNGAYNIIKTSDDNYVFTWFEQVRQGNLWMWIYHMSKINSNGVFIWTRDYYSTFDAGNHVMELPDGRLAMYGWYTDTLGNGRQGMLTMCDSSGQMLALKKYEGSGGLWSLMGGNVTSDGEMIFCGDTYCCNYTPGLGNTSSLWIFKTDSLGYFTTIGALAEELKNAIEWKDPYPNPSTGIFNLDVELSEKFDEFTMDVYDIYSRKIESVKLNKGKNIFQLDLSAEKSGQYLVVVAAKEYKMQVKKILINR